MDGGSKDQTVEVIKKYAHRLDYWVSEKDRGQSHAINKGLARCTGDFQLDQFRRHAGAGRVVGGGPGVGEQARFDCVGRNTELFDENGTVRIVQAREQTLRNFVRFWEATDFGWTQQGTFLPTKETKAVGVREDLVYCMDYDLMVKLLMRGAAVTYVDRPLSRFRCHPESKTVGAKKDFRLERVRALRELKNLPIKVEPWEWEARAGAADGRYGAARVAGWLLWPARPKYFCDSVTTSPRGAISEISRRAAQKVKRTRKKR